MKHMLISGFTAASLMMGSTALAQEVLTAVHAFPTTLV